MNSALPEAAQSLGMALPIRQLRYPLDRQPERAAQRLMGNALCERQQLRRAERPLSPRKARFTYTTWAFPAAEFANTVLAYKLFCKEHYARTGFRCDMPGVSFR